MRLAPAANFQARLSGLGEALRQRGLAALVVGPGPNLAYLTGLFASAGLLVVTPERCRLIVDPRYAEAAEERCAEVPAIELVPVVEPGSYEETLAATVAGLGRATVGFEADHFSVRQYDDLERRLASLGATGIMLEATDGLVESLRLVKDAWELSTLREAGARLSDVAKCIIPKALAGSVERDLAGVIEAELRRAGFDRPAFDTIVASGPNAARPHHRAGARRMEPGDLVVVDFGGVLDGYAVDLTRTLVLGPVGDRERRLIEEVADAQAAAFAAVRVGAAADAIDAAARNHLAQAGLGEAFTHGTGHGLGLEVHEGPRLGRKRTGTASTLLAAGMVFTLEPGAYVPGWGGARIEDDVAVTATGGEWLTDVPRAV